MRFLRPASPSSIRRRIASGRPGRSGCSRRQLSKAITCGRSSRTLTASLSTLGRPVFDFLALLTIDILRTIALRMGQPQEKVACGAVGYGKAESGPVWHGSAR